MVVNTPGTIKQFTINEQCKPNGIKVSDNEEITGKYLHVEGRRHLEGN